MDLKKFLKTVKLSEQTVSTILGALVIVVIGIFIFNYFQKNQTQVTNKAAQTTDTSVKLVEENGEMVPQGLPTTHTVVAGENLWTISLKYYGSGYNWVDIARENKLGNANKLLVGQELSIPKTAVKQVVEKKVDNQITDSSYTVSKGDSVWKIAVRAYGDGFQWVKIAEANNLKNPNIIVPGQVLTLPR
jgi:nucleoid-associated protein YgaU